MSFLSPWFLAGALLIAGPILAHLIRRSTRDRVVFSALRFLDESRPRLQRRSRLQHPLLLALRCLIVALLALAFARPFLPTETTRAPAGAQRQDVVIVLDDSASMRRTGLWEDARERVTRTLQGLREADRATVLLVSGDARTLVSAEQFAGLPASERAGIVQSALNGVSPGWGPSRLDVGVAAALDTFAEAPEGAVRRRVVVVSDFASSVRISGLAGLDWPPGVEVTTERLAIPLANNAGVHWVGWTDQPAGERKARLRVARDRAGIALPLQLRVFNAATGESLGQPVPVDLSPGEARTFEVALDTLQAEAFRVELTGDSEAFDNQAWVVPDVPRVVRVAYIGTDEPNDPQRALFYLQRALSSTPGADIRVERIGPQDPADRIGQAELLVLAAPPGEALMSAVRDRVAAGAFAIALVSSPELLRPVSASLGENGWSVAPGGRRDALLLGQIDFTHPLFSLFGDPRYSDFTRIRFWRPTPLQVPADSTATVVARYDDDQAAIAEKPVGRGRWIVWGGDWAPVASQWVLSSKFVPWLQAVLERASGGPARALSADVSSLASLGAREGATWRPAGSDEFSATAPVGPGAYQLRQDTRARWVTVQVPVEESRTDALPLDAFEQLGVPLRSTAAAVSPATQGRPDPAVMETENRQKLWRWLLLLTAGLLLGESLLAWVLGRRAARGPVSTSDPQTA